LIAPASKPSDVYASATLRAAPPSAVCMTTTGWLNRPPTEVFIVVCPRASPKH